tara:strand:+ start:417 stop:647 length:231 start_codon:yes stop_codon:yes gene_type:complete
MEFDEEFSVDHLIFKTRKCRVCEQEKSLIEDFYLTRKSRGKLASSYSYECKVCTIKRILDRRKKGEPFPEWIYPDW